MPVWVCGRRMLMGVGGVSGAFVALLTVAAKVTPVGGLIGAVRAGERFVSGVGAHVALHGQAKRLTASATRRCRNPAPPPTAGSMPMPMPVAATWEGGENSEQDARTHARINTQLYRRHKAAFLPVSSPPRLKSCSLAVKTQTRAPVICECQQCLRCLVVVTALGQEDTSASPLSPHRPSLPSTQ
ncbi:hypothetical protein E2C01_044911 [Portunus trituberculatus]|uniref:Uncharacterized protein n=1 Tax=Portunus trituberculatus TaxID=210409 RepID=A0A5B7G0M3_PORTR|nr:hypothetical protein [Portunus trituberculatus]